MDSASGEPQKIKPKKKSDQFKTTFSDSLPTFVSNKTIHDDLFTKRPLLSHSSFRYYNTLSNHPNILASDIMMENSHPKDLNANGLNIRKLNLHEVSSVSCIFLMPFNVNDSDS